MRMDDGYKTQVLVGSLTQLDWVHKDLCAFCPAC